MAFVLLSVRASDLSGRILLVPNHIAQICRLLILARQHTMLLIVIIASVRLVTPLYRGRGDLLDGRRDDNCSWVRHFISSSLTVVPIHRGNDLLGVGLDLHYPLLMLDASQPVLHHLLKLPSSELAKAHRPP